MSTTTEALSFLPWTTLEPVETAAVMATLMPALKPAPAEPGRLILRRAPLSFLPDCSLISLFDPGTRPPTTRLGLLGPDLALVLDNAGRAWKRLLAERQPRLDAVTVFDYVRVRLALAKDGPVLVESAPDDAPEGVAERLGPLRLEGVEEAFHLAATLQVGDTLHAARLKVLRDGGLTVEEGGVIGEGLAPPVVALR